MSDANVHVSRAAPRTAWLFDVDGVLTDPERKVVAEEALFDELLLRLAKGEPVGLNTGRSVPFIVEGVLEPLEARASDPHLLRDVIAIGEKGGVWIDYPASAPRAIHVDAGVAVPADLQAAVRALVARPPFAETMFYDETKQTMISVELRADTSIAAFAPRQRELEAALRTLLADHPRASELRIDPSRIATDIEDVRMGKGYAAAQYVTLLAARGIFPARFVCFGDSASDYAMLAELLRLGKPAELVFVGERHLLAGNDTAHVTFTAERCDRGTLSYLRAHE